MVGKWSTLLAESKTLHHLISKKHMGRDWSASWGTQIGQKFMQTFIDTSVIDKKDWF